MTLTLSSFRMEAGMSWQTLYGAVCIQGIRTKGRDHMTALPLSRKR